MAVYKEEKTNTWRAVYRYTDWNGERKQTQKRGFKTKREAQASCARTAPMLITSACACEVISSTSRSSCAMMAVPPAARMIFAQSLMVTLLVMECTIGVRFCVFSRTVLMVSINA